MSIRDCAKFVLSHAQYVSISKERIREFAQHAEESDILPKSLLEGFAFRNIEEKVNFIFFFNTMHFAFWGYPRWQVKIGDKHYQGTKALLHLLKKALEKNLLLAKSEHVMKLSLSDFTRLLKGENELLFIEERWRTLRQGANILHHRFNGSFFNVIKEGDNDARKVLKLLTEYFPSFDDRAIYHDQEIEFHKRAQITISMLHTSSDKELSISHMDYLTCSADYRLPQLLRHFGILQYSKELSKKIDAYIYIPSGSPQEVEMRAATVQAVELIKDALFKQKGKIYMSWEIDNYLWSLAQKYKNTMKPHHMTSTIYY